MGRISVGLLPVYVTKRNFCFSEQLRKVGTAVVFALFSLYHTYLPTYCQLQLIYVNQSIVCVLLLN